MSETASTSQKPSPVGRQKCPQCDADIPVHSGYVTWCEKCGWNLLPEEIDPPNNIFEAMYASINARLSRGLFNKLVSTPSLKPAFTWSKAIAYMVAGLVHGTTLALAALGVLLVLFTWPFLILTAVGLSFLGAAWLLAPRPPKLDKEANVVSREDFPALYELVDRVAGALDTSSVDAIVVDENYNAAFGQYGWRRKKVLFIGLPLFAVLNPQERLAIIGHEIAHGVNGDAARGFFIGTALRSLITWHGILRPDEVISDSGGGFGASCAMIPAHMIMRGLAWPVLWLVHALANLLWRDSQRAEYLADALAASVGGTGATVSAFEKFQFSQTFEIATQRAATYFKEKNLFDDLRERVKRAPERELERIGRVTMLPTAQLATTHPPTAYRIEMLRAHPVTSPKVELTEEESAQIDKELLTLEAGLQEKVVQSYEDSFY